MKTKKVYFNDAQRYLLYLGANSETIIAARRFGKSDGIIAPRMLRNAQHMPRSAGAFYAATFQQALSRTIPAAVAALERWGYYSEKHFFIGRKAPDKLGFRKPYIEPRVWDHCIHWYNGSVVNILSQDVKFSANSLTLDYLIIDEARSVKKEKLFAEAIPAISGVIGHFDNVPWHKGITIVSDMPQGKDGEWLLNRKASMEQDVIDAIEGTLSYIEELKERKTIFARNQLYSQRKFLKEMRRIAHVYKEFDAIENLELLGEGYIALQKRELTPLLFLTCILNKRITKLKQIIFRFRKLLLAFVFLKSIWPNAYAGGFHRGYQGFIIGAVKFWKQRLLAGKPIIYILMLQLMLHWFTDVLIVHIESARCEC
ncbi:MAG: hypothetical protein UY18_C0036G0007 [Microgenomates group bacterium GW2011_GWF2_47_9]|nr:MAG: hypothetical protein UY18_C0036G0007 [Microgenomates group bacterium GW2011_GWF2_47_9]